MDTKIFYYEGHKVQPGDDRLPATVRHFLSLFLDESPTLTVRTSGSTGPPKELRVKKEYMRASARKTLEYLQLKPGERILLCLPLEHIAGMMMLVRWIEGGLDLTVVPSQSRPLHKLSGHWHFAAMVPYQAYHSLPELPRIDKLIIGGGSLLPALEQRLIGLPTQVWHTYGMTETLSHVAMRAIKASTRSHYEALPGVRFTQNEVDCLVVDAPHLGVSQLPTRDVVELHDPHHFSWQGRLDNVVLSGGVKLYPERIEARLGPLGPAAFMAGLPDPALGEKLCLFIEADKPLPEVRLREYLQRLEGYEKPREIYYLPQFSRTENGKLQRQRSVDLWRQSQR